MTPGQSLAEHRSGSQFRTDAVAKARGADAVILFGGLNKSDHQDCEGHDRLSYELPYGQDKLAEALAQANRNFVFVDISGNAVAMPWKNQVSAIVQAWYLGSEAGDAIADVLTGKVNPSGKLPFTWPTSLEDVGAYRLNAYPGIWRPDHQIIDETYKEGIYVGYRWVDHAHIHPLFAFGHGLSYTTFRLSDLRASAQSMSPDGTITFKVRVKNTGKRDGAETVQLYVHENRCSVDRPYKELKGFRKIFLKAGENRDVSITIDRSALSFWDENSNGWQAEKGAFEVLVGDASDHLPLKLAFKLI